LRAYLKGEYGESFRRGAYEIFRASLATQHQEILRQVKNEEFENLKIAINNCQLTKQLNIIASEEWFNLLINHNFPTNNISLLRVDLHQKYLHHRTYGKKLDLESAQLQGANLRSAQLQGANLYKTQLQGADLRFALLQGANFWKAQLQGADLIFAQLQGADLILAQLQGANFWSAQLQGADLRSAQLQGAYLSKGFEVINFEQRIKQQLDKKTNEEGLKAQYTALTKDQKVELVATLKAINNITYHAAIERIESAPETLDLSEAITGSYNQKEADKWIKDYKNATNASS